MDIEKLEKLSELKDKGLITQEEFNEQKAKLLAPSKKTQKNNKKIVKYVVISIIAIPLLLLLVPFINGFTKGVSGSFNTSKTLDEISLISSNTRLLYEEQSSYSGLNNLNAKKYGVVPRDMYSNESDDKITNAFGGEVSIQGYGETFLISYSKLPLDICKLIADNDFGYGAGGFVGTMGDFPCSDCRDDCSITLEFQ